MRLVQLNWQWKAAAAQSILIHIFPFDRSLVLSNNMIQIRCVFKVGVFHLCILNKIYSGVLKMEITLATESNG